MLLKLRVPLAPEAIKTQTMLPVYAWNRAYPRTPPCLIPDRSSQIVVTAS
jgi:hypothetical protein